MSHVLVNGHVLSPSPCVNLEASLLFPLGTFIVEFHTVESLWNYNYFVLIV